MDTAGKRATFVWWEFELVPHHTNVCKIRDFVELFFVSFLEQIVLTVGSFNDLKKLKNLSQDPLYNI